MSHTITPRPQIAEAVEGLGPGPLTEASVVAHLHPLFSRALQRSGVYLANHSLGRPLDATAHDVRQALDRWYTDMDDAWEAWLADRDAFRAATASLLRWPDPRAVVPKASCAQALRAVLAALPPKPQGRPHHVLTTRGEFDSIDIVLKTWAHKGRIRVTWVDGRADGSFHASDLIAKLSSDVDLVYASRVLFATGQQLDAAALCEAARKVGVLSMLDLYHSAGVLPDNVSDIGPDFATGGSYKYTRGGPGAAWLAIHPRHLTTSPGVPAKDALFSVDTGWFAKAEPFRYARTDAPALAAGGDAWLEATPNILAAAQARAGLELTLALGVQRIRDYQLQQQERLAEALEAEGVVVKRIPRRGAFILLPRADAAHDCTRLRAAGVHSDARPCPVTGQGYLRLCPDLLNTEAELQQAATRIGRVLQA